jgi:hypothetical protein
VFQEGYKKLALYPLIFGQGQFAHGESMVFILIALFEHFSLVIGYMIFSDNFLFCSAVNKDDLPKMTLLGAGKVFSSVDRAVTDKDIEDILDKREKTTTQPKAKIQNH